MIRSPGFPTENYPHLEDCSWVIRAPPGQQIRLNVTTFELEPHGQVCAPKELIFCPGFFSWVNPTPKSFIGHLFLSATLFRLLRYLLERDVPLTIHRRFRKCRCINKDSIRWLLPWLFYIRLFFWTFFNNDLQLRVGENLSFSKKLLSFWQNFLGFWKNILSFSENSLNLSKNERLSSKYPEFKLG